MNVEQGNGTRSLQVPDLPRELFFRLQAMKANLHCESWQDFVELLVAHGDDVVAVVNGSRAPDGPPARTTPNSDTVE